MGSWAGIATATLVVLALFLGGSAPAFSEATPPTDTPSPAAETLNLVLTGVVTEKGSEPVVAIEGLSVYARADGWGAWTTTDANGKYTFENVPVSSVSVSVVEPSPYVGSPVYSNFSSPEESPIILTEPGVDGFAVPTIYDVQIARVKYSTLTGLVTAKGSDPSVPAVGATVSAHSSEGQWNGEVTTDANGRYTFNYVVGKSVHVSVTPAAPLGTSDAYFSFNSPSESPIVLTEPVDNAIMSTTYDVQLARAKNFTLTGVVTAKGSGTAVPVVGATVYAHSTDWAWQDNRITDADGRYTFLYVPVGSVGLNVQSLSSSEVPAEYLYFSSSYESPIVLTSSIGDVITPTTYNVQLTPAKDLSLTGVVTEKGSNSTIPIAGASIWAYGDGWSGFATTDESGRYTLSHVGVTSLQINVNTGNGDSQPTHLPFNSPYQSQIKLSETTANDYDIQLTKALDKKLTVVLTDADSGDPVTGARINLNGTNGVSWNLPYDAVIDESTPGTYVVEHVAVSAVMLSVSTGSYQQGSSYSGQTHLSSSSTVTLGSGDTTTKVRLKPYPSGPGSIAGIVSGEDADGNTVPLANAGINVSSPSGYSGYVTTSDDGSYSFLNIPAETVNINVNANGYDYWMRSIRVSDTRLTRDVTLKKLPVGTGVIRGTLTNAESDEPVEGIRVSIAGTGQYQFTSTDVDGAYELKDIPKGTFTLQIDTGMNGANDYRPVDYWTTSVTMLTASSVVTGKDFALIPSPRGDSTVGGRVTDSRTGAAVAGAQVSVWSAALEYSKSVLADDSGNWVLSNLPAATDYVVNIYASYLSTASDGSSYEYEYDREVLSLRSGETKTYNATLTSIVAGTGSVTGKIKTSGAYQGEDAAGNPTTVPAYSGIEGVTISLVRTNGGFNDLTTKTGPDGTFTIAGLPAGQYRIYAEATGFAAANVDPSSYFGGGANSVGGVDIGTGRETFSANLNPVLRGASSIHGAVLLDGETSTPAEGASIYALGTETGQSYWLNTEDDGTFNLSSIIPDEYKLSIYPSWSSSGSVGNYAPAKLTVDAISGELLELPPIALVPAATVSGTVATWDLGSPSGVFVTAFDSDDEAVGWAMTASDGSYELSSLPPGDLTFQFSVSGQGCDCQGPNFKTSAYASTYWTGEPEGNPTAGTTISLSPGGARESINVTLQPGGSIAGVVSVEIEDANGVTSGGPLPRGKMVLVEAFAASDTAFSTPLSSTWASSGAGGKYSLQGLAAGRFVVRFTDEWPGQKGYQVSTSRVTTVATGDVAAVVNVAMKQRPAPDVPAPVQDAGLLTLGAMRDAIDAPASADSGSNITITVGLDQVGEYVMAYMNSTPTALTDSWMQVSADGTITVPVKSSLAKGVTHTIVIQDVNGAVIGFTRMQVNASSVSSGLGVDPRVGIGASSSNSSQRTPSRSSTSIPGAEALGGATVLEDSGNSASLPPALQVPNNAEAEVHSNANTDSSPAGFPLALVLVILLGTLGLATTSIVMVRRRRIG